MSDQNSLEVWVIEQPNGKFQGYWRFVGEENWRKDNSGDTYILTERPLTHER